MSVVAAAAGTIVAAQRSSVPSGVRVTWSQRRDTVIVAVEFPSDSAEPQVSFSDCGLVAVQAVAALSGERWDVQLQCSHKIDAAQSRRLCPHRPRGHTRGQRSAARHVQERHSSAGVGAYAGGWPPSAACGWCCRSWRWCGGTGWSRASGWRASGWTMSAPEPERREASAVPGRPWVLRAWRARAAPAHVVESKIRVRNAW